MVRVARAELDRLNAEVALERLAAARGVELVERAGRLVGACPFCGTVDALSVDPAVNTWWCSGCAHTAGSAVEWVMRAEGVSARHAVELLRAGVAPGGSGRPPRSGSVRRLPPPVDVDSDDGEEPPLRGAAA